MQNVPIDCQALWTDDGVDGKLAQNGVDAQIPRALGIRLARKWRGLLFAAFAFKYRAPVPDEDLPYRGAIARQLLDVPTTSGPATGVAMTEQRAKALRGAVGDQAILAVASGITSENAMCLAPYFDIVLAASSLESGGRAEYSGLLIPEKVRQLADAIHSLDNSTATSCQGVLEEDETDHN